MTLDLRWIAAAALAVAVAGCETIPTQVTTRESHALGADRTFVMVPDETQRDSERYRQYAGLVAGHLERRGFRPEPDERRAALGVVLAWEVGPGQKVILREPIFDRGPHSGVFFGVGNAHDPRYDPFWRHGYYGDPFGYDGYARVVGTRETTFTEYPKSMTLRIVDLANREATGAPTLYEATAATAARDAALDPVAPCLIAALFTDFPRAAGGPRRVSVPAEACPGAHR